jgi:hypothetical protein
MIPCVSNRPIENTIDSEGQVNDHGLPSSSPQISTIYYEPLVRFRQMRVEMNLSFDKNEVEDDCPSIERESVKAAAFSCEYENDSNKSSKSHEIR